MYTDTKLENRKRINNYHPQTSDGKVDFYPAYIQIEQTNRCNAECIMCNHFYLGNRGCADLDLSVIEKIEPILPYCETIMLNGDGEPFLCGSIEENLERFVRFGIKIGTNTNLSYLSERILECIRSSFEFLNISCDGASPETYEMIRQGLSFKRFVENLDELRKKVPNVNRYFDCVVMKQNIKDMPEIVKLAGKNGISAVKFQRLGVNPLIGNDNDQVEYYYDLFLEKLNEACREGERNGVKVSFPNYIKFSGQHILPLYSDMISEIGKRRTAVIDKCRESNLNLSNDYYSVNAVPSDFTDDTWYSGKPCQWALERCYVDLKGNVTTCCFNMKKKMGSLREKSFDEIWNGEEYIAFRKLMAANRLPAFCRQCNWIKDSKF